jgi:hypothetical protein
MWVWVMILGIHELVRGPTNFSEELSNLGAYLEGGQIASAYFNHTWQSLLMLMCTRGHVQGVMSKWLAYSHPL